MLADFFPPHQKLVKGKKLHHRVEKDDQRGEEEMEKVPEEADVLLRRRGEELRGQSINDEHEEVEIKVSERRDMLMRKPYLRVNCEGKKWEAREKEARKREEQQRRIP